MSNSLQSDHSQVYSHQKPLSFLASRVLTVKTINFFGFDGAEKVEDKVDVASGRFRRKITRPFFAKLYSLTVFFEKTSVFKASAMTVTRLWAAMISKFTVWWVVTLQSGPVAVSKRLQSAHSQVYSHQKPLCFLASRDLTIKTINFFSLGGVEKVKKKKWSWCCFRSVRRKITRPFFAKLYSLTVFFRKTQCFQGFIHGCNQTVGGDNPKVYSLVGSGTTVWLSGCEQKITARSPPGLQPSQTLVFPGFPGFDYEDYKLFRFWWAEK